MYLVRMLSGVRTLVFGWNLIFRCVFVQQMIAHTYLCGYALKQSSIFQSLIHACELNTYVVYNSARVLYARKFVTPKFYGKPVQHFLGRFKSDLFDVIAKGVIYANSRFII